ncbi:MAG TPA: TIGR01777 family oxidoreductase [Candidatus Thermoplasmatota archaeon]|nr:TIGR01777 family oxidoreductase [Candidatus Thermoplasmatota archaeon]
MRVLVTGASGRVGRRVVAALQARFHEVVATSRSPAAHEWPKGTQTVEWDGERHLRVDGPLHGVVNLAGAGIMDRRWSKGRMRELVESRVRLTRHLAGFINRLPRPRPVLVSASGVGAYGSADASAMHDETSPYGSDFLADLCRQWEEAASRAETRVVILRFGHVMDASAGYLGKLLPLLKLGVGGHLGTGKQGVPWIHHEDLARLIAWALEEPSAHGVYNAVAGTVDNATLVRTAADVLGKPAAIPVPAAALRLRFGQGAQAILEGQHVTSSRLGEEGFAFTHPELREALADLLAKK